MEKQRVIAVDFDGCLCDNAYPDIGAPNWQVIDAALKERADGAALILWTCREGDMLQQALDACKGWGLEFDAVNDSLPKWKETWKNDPRKIGATEYWDDKAVRMPNIDPVTAAAEALGMSPDRLRELAQAEKEGRLANFPFIAMVEQSLRDGAMKPMSDQKHNGRYAVVYKSERWTSPFIDICGTPYNTEQAVERMREISREAAEAALKEREDDPCKS